MINVKERNLKESCYGIFSIAFIINFFIFLLFIGNFNAFIYTYIILFDIFTLINLIFIKKLYNFIELYSSISLSLFSLILFVSGLYELKKNLNIFNFIEITILLLIIYLSIIILSINHIIKFYTKENYQKKILSRTPKYFLFFSVGILGMYLGKLPLNKNFVNTFSMLVLGCLFAICYSHFYRFYLINKNKR